MVDSAKHHTGKNMPAIIYSNLLSYISSVPHYSELYVLTPPMREKRSSEENSNSEVPLIQITWAQLGGSEILVSQSPMPRLELKQWNFLDKNVQNRRPEKAAAVYFQVL